MARLEPHILSGHRSDGSGMPAAPHSRQDASEEGAACFGDRLALSAPLRVYYDITYQCNLACAYCYNKNSAVPGRRLLSIEEKMSLLDQMKAMGTRKLSIAGGEPFLDRDLHPFVKRGAELGMSISVTTNGTCISDAAIDFIRSGWFKRITVSMDGVDEKANKHRFGQSLKTVIRNVQRLKSETGADVSLKTVLGIDASLGDLAALIRFAEQMSIGTVKVSFLRKKAPEGASELDSAVHGYFNMMWQISQMKATTHVKIAMPSTPFDNAFGYPNLSTGWGCAAGKDLMYVNPYGDVKPCVMLSNDFVMGNLLERPLFDIWREGAPQLFAANNDECRACEYATVCYGGCRARAIQYFGRPDSRDVFCFRRYVDGTASPQEETARLKAGCVAVNGAYCITHL